MPLHLQLQSTPGGSYIDIDLTAYAVATMKLRISYTHPSMLEMEMSAPQHTYPLGIRNFLRLWDDDDPTQSASNPVFEGFIEEVKPGEETNSVKVVAYDPTRKVSSDVTIMSLEWDTETSPDAGAIPRVVFNVSIDNDDDFAFSRTFYETMGGIMQMVFDDQAKPLRYANACPNPGNAYHSSDLAALSFIPQEKIVFETETIRSAMERILRWEPAWRMLWYPGTRQWRFGDITQSPAVTITLNSFVDGGSATTNVLSLQLDRSLEGRRTAVKIYGPPVLVQTELTLGGGGLTDLSDNTLLQNDVGSCCNVEGKNRWQITDPDLRKVARRLQLPTDVQYDDYYWATTFSPALLGYWPASSAGNAGWRVINDWHIDARSGIIEINANNFVYRYNPNPAGGQPNFENPTDMKFIYATYGEPISVRYPASGFQGTAYTVANMQTRFDMYDEMLAVAYEYNQPVTTATRLAQFAFLAQRELQMRQDIIYAGGCMLEELQYDYMRLNRRVNFAGVDQDGNPLTTGLEAINALLTDVEYDFNERTTTLTFSSDQLELCGINPEELKRRLGVKQLMRVDFVDVTWGTTIREKRISDPVTGFSQQSKVHETTFNIQQSHEYVDPDTGINPDTGRDPTFDHQQQNIGLNAGPES